MAGLLVESIKIKACGMLQTSLRNLAVSRFFLIKAKTDNRTNGLLLIKQVSSY